MDRGRVGFDKKLALSDKKPGVCRYCERALSKVRVDSKRMFSLTLYFSILKSRADLADQIDLDFNSLFLSPTVIHYHKYRSSKIQKNRALIPSSRKNVFLSAALLPPRCRLVRKRSLSPISKFWTGLVKVSTDNRGMRMRFYRLFLGP